MNTQSAPPKHTPGPWITDTGKVPKLGNVIGVLKQSHKPGEKGDSICVVALTKDAEPHDHANARLIAAAPDLLEACKLAIERTPPNSKTLLPILQAAVGKALGHSRMNSKINKPSSFNQ